MSASFMSLLPSIIGAGTSLIGDLFGQSGQQDTNAMQMQMMLQNENWQEHMSDTQMQRRVTDLKAAGLNPLLAVNSGGAAMGSVSTPQLGNPGASFQNLGQQMTSALGLQRLKADIDNVNADTKTKEVTVGNVAADTALKGVTIAQVEQALSANLPDANRRKIEQELEQIKQETATSAEQAKTLGAQGKAATAAAGASDAQAATSRAQAKKIGLETDLTDLDVKQRRGLFDEMFMAAAAQARAAQSSAQAQHEFNNSLWGRIWHAITGSSSPTAVGPAIGGAIKAIP